MTNEVIEKIPEDGEPISNVLPTKGKGRVVRRIMLVGGILLMIGGIITGLLLVKRNQDIREKAVGGAECGQSASCIKLDNPTNSGTYTPAGTVDYVIVKAGIEAYRYPGDSSGCYSVTISQNIVSWSKIGPVPDCKDVSHIEIWLSFGTPTNVPPTPTATLAQPTPTPTRPTTLPTLTPTKLPTQKPTATPTVTVTPTATPTGTLRPTATPTLTNTPTPTGTPRPTATGTLRPTATPTLTPTLTPTGQPTGTITPTPTATPIVNSPTATNTPGSSSTPTPTGLSKLTACLGDRVVFDSNRNGIQETDETGIAGAGINVYDNNSNLVATATSDNAGYYKICNLNPATYTVKFKMPTGYILSEPYRGSNRDLDSDPEINTGITATITLVGGDNNLTVDALGYVVYAADQMPVSGMSIPLIGLLGTVVVFFVHVIQFVF